MHIKLADFGLSEVGLTNKLSLNNEYQVENIENNISTKRSLSPKQQKKNRVIGTPDYIPPEVISGMSTSNKSIDWWSLGVMTYEFVVGCR